MTTIPSWSFDTRRDEIAAEIHAVLVETARKRRTIAYSDLASRLESFEFQPNDPRLYRLLDDISREEVEAGRGMLSVVVVHKDDKLPGTGFFELAKALGRKLANTHDPRARDRVFIDELARVHDENRRR